MNQQPPAILKLSTVNLSGDGARVVPGGGEANVPVTAAAALAALQAFTRLPAVALVDVEAKIYLAGPRGKVAVQNLGGQLSVVLLPEGVNTAARCTPEETLAWVSAGDSATASAVAAATGSEAAAIDASAPAARRWSGWRRRLNSIWTVAGLGLVAALLGYVSFAPDTPEGIELMRAPAKIARLHAEYNGHYGVREATTLVLENGRLTGQQTMAPDAPAMVLFEKSYVFGLREKQVVLVLDNGALLEPQSDRSLKFLESTYPRQGK